MKRSGTESEGRCELTGDKISNIALFYWLILAPDEHLLLKGGFLRLKTPKQKRRQHGEETPSAPTLINVGRVCSSAEATSPETKSACEI